MPLRSRSTKTTPARTTGGGAVPLQDDGLPFLWGRNRDASALAATRRQWHDRQARELARRIDRKLRR